jgi:hypothetical protein
MVPADSSFRGNAEPLVGQPADHAEPGGVHDDGGRLEPAPGTPQFPSTDPQHRDRSAESTLAGTLR